MNTGYKQLGSHAFFFREGDAYTVPSSGTCSRTTKPGPTDTGWIDFGVISGFDIDAQSELKEKYAPVPGRLVLYDVHETKRKIAIKFKAEQLSPLAWELMLRTLALSSASTQYNPEEGVVKKGWLKFQQYDQDNTLVNTTDVWVHLKAKGQPLGNDTTEVDVEALVLHSTLNTGTLAA